MTTEPGGAAGVHEKPGGRTRPVAMRSEPSHFWIAYAARSWRFRTGSWTDLARGVLGSSRKPDAEGGLPDLEVRELDDLFYLPPVDSDLAADRDALADRLTSEGTPVLLQLTPGEKTSASSAEGLLRVVYDLVEPLLAGELEQLAEVPESALAAWPMIPGLTDELELWDDGLEILELRRVACVQPLILDLTPLQRRRLAEGRDEEVFDALFHGRLDSRVERGFSGRAYRRGLKLFAERPEAGGVGLRKRSNRTISAQLTLAGELWLRLDRSTTVGQGFLRAARGAESTHHDLAAIAREGNLEVIDWLTVPARELVEEWSEKGRAGLVAELHDEYLRLRPGNGAPPS